ncbi:beta-glucuronidase, partial [Streptomyces sp. TRM76130]|nr:beta-glucuronidase [Streptomyces sp. TRM76130]
MLRPRDTSTRERRSLNGLWAFRLDPEGAGREAGWWRSRLPGAREMPVPASYNDIVPDLTVRDHVGDAWYQTTVRIPAGWSGQRIVLRFDAATHRAAVWVDDALVAEHEGGYTPFEADVTDHV